MADDIFQSVIPVKVRDESFEFKIPTIHDEIRIGARMRELQKKLDPAWDGFGTLDFNTTYLLRACATFELLLQKGPKWCFSESRDAKDQPVVTCDTGVIPPARYDAMLAAYSNYSELLAFFREHGTTNKPAVGTEAVAGQPGT